MIPARDPRRGAVLILVVGLIAILATIATAFLARSRGSASVGEDAVRLAQTRIMLHAAMTYIREASRLGYAVMEGGGDPAIGDLLVDDPREAWGWIDTRTVVPGGGSRIGPNDVEGRPLWTAGEWPAPGSVLRAPMYRMERPPYAITQDYVRNPIPSDIAKPTFGVPFMTNPDPLPQLPGDSYLDLDDPTASGQTSLDLPSAHPAVSPGGSVARKTWAMGDRTPVTGSADLGWFRIYRETIAPGGSGGVRSTEPREQGVPAGAGSCTFVVTVGAGGSRGFRDWGEVVAAGAATSFGSNRAFFDEIIAREQRQQFRIGWSAAVGGGEDLIQMPEINGWVAGKGKYSGMLGPARSQYEGFPLNASRWRSDEIVAPSQPRNYGGTITFIQRLDEAPLHW